MCGICGYVGAPANVDDDAVVTAMGDALVHRGPEGAGSWAIAGGGDLRGRLGHRRLRIVDLSDAAAQPMVSDDRQIALTFNGELYGFRELRRELAARGHGFRSTGDTEVALRAYEEWGEAFVERIDGMFALAIWDGRQDRLILARDRVGKKPLFLHQAAGRITFASEIKALARAPWISIEPDVSVLPEILTLGYVPAPRTAYRGIEELPPATIAAFDPHTNTCSRRTFWSPLPDARVDQVDAAIREEIAERLAAAVERRLVADVPKGALLSGGIDSSVVCALMARLSGERVVTFSVGFPDAASFDERPYARLMADRLRSDHVELTVRADAAALLDRLVWLYDGPFGDSSAVATYVVCAAARERMTVVLTGDGGDEAFAGYQRFAAAAVARALGRHAGAARALLPLLPGGDDFYGLRRRGERFVAAAAMPELDRYLHWISIFDRDSLASLGIEGSAAGATVRDAVAEASGLPPIDSLLHANLRTYLPGDLLVKVDRASMAHSLEARAPFLDTGLLELLARIPARAKVGFRRPKPLLRACVGELVPAEIWDRPKHGFGVPVDHWFAGELGDRYADEVLAPNGRARAWLSPVALERLLNEHRAGVRANGARLWSVLLVERWLRDAATSQPLREPRRVEPVAIE